MDIQSSQALPQFKTPPRVLIVEARYYPRVSDALLDGAKDMLARVDASVHVLTLSGALEIPSAIRIADKKGGYDGYIALGCVIRGETSHYDIVSEQSAAGLMTLGVVHGLPIGNGILTVETIEQAMERAATTGQDKGGFAARACLEIIAWGQKS